MKKYLFLFILFILTSCASEYTISGKWEIIEVNSKPVSSDSHY
jgi:hypothetical protein